MAARFPPLQDQGLKLQECPRAGNCPIFSDWYAFNQRVDVTVIYPVASVIFDFLHGILFFLRQLTQYLPGQFAELSIFGKGESPIGIASSPTQPGYVEFTVQKAGVVTSALHEMEVGTVMGIRGPLGNSWPIGYLEGKNIVIVGGGFAFTTLRSLGINGWHACQGDFESGKNILDTQDNRRAYSARIKASSYK